MAAVYRALRSSVIKRDPVSSGRIKAGDRGPGAGGRWLSVSMPDRNDSQNFVSPNTTRCHCTRLVTMSLLGCSLAGDNNL